MGYRLAPGISFALHDRNAIVLDLRCDRYRQLGDELTAVLVSAGHSDLPARTRGIERLISERLLIAVAGPTDIAPVSLIIPPLSALEIDVLPDLNRLRIGQVVSTLFMTRLCLHAPGLHATIGSARALRARTSLTSQPHRALQIAQAFAAKRTACPLARACVLDSLALSRLLCRAGVDHDVAFGVRFDPFTAHAWVQTDSHILSDNAAPVASNLPVFRL
jgi:hypothetical protein